ncbi:nucleotidyltransferase family protein [Aeropyrum pernix]|uniref:nucleotidyltransferase family protein n=1 Tax=Aeropyrum pernix TaxID=56636 RepID=UPI000A9363CC|nr:NTP transferase domain-containing protein [Aeropyrum pernix]
MEGLDTLLALSAAGLLRPRSGIYAVVLAAGMSRRMGFNKLLAPLCGKRVLWHVLELVARFEGVLEGAVVVTSGEVADVLRRERPPGRRGLFRVVVNREQWRGLSHSIRLGVEASPGARAYLFFNGDRPFVSKHTVARVLALYMARRPLIAAPMAGGAIAPPVVVDSRLRGELLRLSGDTGVRSLFGKYRDSLAVVEVDDPGLHLDVDTPEDLERASKMCSQLGGGPREKP